jgi:hypothetical protein
VRTRELIAIVALAAAAAVVVIGGTPTAIRAPAGAVLLFLFAYGWSCLLLPRGTVDGVERVLATIALGFSLTVMLTLAIHQSPLRVTRGSWALGFAIVGAVPFVLTGHQRRTLDPEPPRMRWIAPSSRDIKLCLGALVVLAVTAVLARRPLPPPAGVDGYTQLWLVPRVSAAEIGVASYETSTTSYRLDVVVGGRTQRWTFRLRPTERWKTTLPASGEDAEARLYRGGSATIYRRVSAPLTTVPARR